jgi:hypothetical protein
MKAKNRQERYKKGYILLEGKRLIADAIQAGADLLTIFVTDRQILDVNIHLLKFRLFKPTDFFSPDNRFFTNRSQFYCLSNISQCISYMV